MITRVLVRLTAEEVVELKNWEVEVEARGDVVGRDLLEVRLVLNDELGASVRGERITLGRLKVDVRALKGRT